MNLRKKTYDLTTTVNEEKIKEFVAQIAEDVKVEPVNASHNFRWSS